MCREQADFEARRTGRLCGDEAAASRPVHLETLGALHGLPRLLSHDADEVAFDDDLHDAGKLADRAFIDAADGGANLGRTHDATVQHAWDLDVVDELESARHHVAHVHARNRRTENGPLARVFARG